MQPIQQVTAQALQQISVTKSTPPAATGKTRAGQMGSSEEQIATLIGQVFALLQRLYPRTWDAGWKTAQEVTESKRSLLKLLTKNGVAPSEACIERMEQSLVKRGGDWPPSIAELAVLLAPQPEDYGLPNIECAWQMARNNARNPRVIASRAVRTAGDGLWYEISRASSDYAFSQLKKQFAERYHTVAQQVMQGDDLAPRQLLERPEPRPLIDRVQLTPEQQAEAMRIKQAVFNRIKRKQVA